MPGAPSVASNAFTDDVYVGWDAFLGEGNTDIYLSTSANAGQSFGPVTPSVATDRYGAVYVAWEENRGGPDTDIIFARGE
jgi:hypothetical protein